MSKLPTKWDEPPEVAEMEDAMGEEHTSEPWEVIVVRAVRWFEGMPQEYWIYHDCKEVAHVTSIEDARRIVACVNACAGVGTEALEGGRCKVVIDWVKVRVT